VTSVSVRFSILSLAKPLLFLHPKEHMKKIKLLLASYDRRSNALIEAAVRDACYEQAIVECYKTSRVDEFFHQAAQGLYDLVVVSPNHLLPEPSRRGGCVTPCEVAGAVQGIKRQCGLALLAVNVMPKDEATFIEAAADAVFGTVWDAAALKVEVRRTLNLTEPGELVESPRWSWSCLFRLGSRRPVGT